MTIPIAIAAWDAHHRQQLALQRALANNELIRDSRRRLVRAADDERRRVERNLHDGAQQQLVAVTMQLRLLQSQRDDLPEIEPLVAELESSLTNLRELAHGLYPPLLRSRGLSDALKAAANRSPLRVTVTTDGVGRHDVDLEAAIYFCCLEALQNAAKYAGEAATVQIEVAEADGVIRGSISDDGPGFSAESARDGLGLRNMEDRIGAVGGDLQIEARHGTRIQFVVPGHSGEQHLRPRG